MIQAIRLLAISGAALAASVISAAAQDATTRRPSPLPGGATSLSETYEDWQVLCGAQDGKAACNVTQTQMQQNTGQRVLDIRLNPAGEDGSVQGLLTLPFGLDLARGVTVQVDDGKATEPLAFSTCLPSGCLVPLALDKAQLATMRNGKALALKAASVQGQEAPFAISLKGFAKAIDRAAGLVR